MSTPTCTWSFIVRERQLAEYCTRLSRYGVPFEECLNRVEERRAVMTGQLPRRIEPQNTPENVQIPR